MTATWTVLGAGSILPRVGFGCAGYALRTAPGGPVTLFDCGPGTVRQLAAAGIGVGEVRRAVISHFHVDHCLDLFALFFARRNPGLGFVPPLEVIGPRGLGGLVEGVVATIGHFARDPDARVREVLLDRAGRGSIATEELQLECAATGHTPEALAWRATLPGGAVVAYTGDTGENPAVAVHARGADLFVCECSHPDGEAVANHLTPSSAARLARDAGAHKLLLSHFYPGLEPETARRAAAKIFTGPIETARDGSVHGFDAA